MERLRYDLSEIEALVRWLHEQRLLVERCHAHNWRRLFASFCEAMVGHYEAGRLLARLLEGHRGVDCAAWFEEAAAGSPPPPPTDPYELLALVWQQVRTAVPTAGEGFNERKCIDLPYVMSNAFKGGSLGERFEHWRLDYVVPFVNVLGQWLDAMLASAQKCEGVIDLWDEALAALADLPKPAGGDASSTIEVARSPEATISSEPTPPSQDRMAQE